MKKTISLLCAFACTASAASAQIVFTETFNYTGGTNPLINIAGWSWQSVTVAFSDASGQRQFSRISSNNGIGGTAGFAYNAPQRRPRRGSLTHLVQWTIIFPINSRVDQRLYRPQQCSQRNPLVVQVEGEGWFATTQSWTTPAMTAGNFPTQAQQVTFDFVADASAWRPLAFDGLLGDASSGFAVFSGDQSANALAGNLPSGSITAVGVYHYMAAGAITRFDNFTVTAIPEPSTYAAIFGALALGLIALRRRRK
ncbi:MAG: PEP-CTERM sorting domain-containing protein [Verrucomicrobia bacterium]|nr:PEP-CTERM sorting domain-containing protein [Verrucomicrobiota bacterium]